ncbi:MAG TPA: hypothetical protein VN706_16255 [Gemmatimonadaceae bacterium]|nr:hypothetical protein [Gemmatimonadaceae bacterium]
MNSSRRLLLALAAAASVLTGLAACANDATAPSASQPRSGFGVPSAAHRDIAGEDDPNFLNIASTAPSIANPVITFTATKGRDTVVKMYFRARASGHGHDSTVFAAFKVPAKALAYRPDGTPILDGQSVTITMTLVDSVHGIIDFQPSGLRFSTKNPATLRISFADDDPDLNQDGTVNAVDLALAANLHMICRESPDSQWFRIPSTLFPETGEVEGIIYGFSGYSIEF